MLIIENKLFFFKRDVKIPLKIKVISKKEGLD